MKIRINHINAQETKIMELDVDDKSSFHDLSLLIKKKVEHDVILLPEKIKGIHSGMTVKQYCSESREGLLDIDFKAINIEVLTQQERTILNIMSLNFSELSKNFIENEKKVSNHLVSTKEFIHLCQLLPEDMQEAIIVRLADKMDMFGKTFKDCITQDVENGETRYSVQVHPYPWLAAGATNVIIHQNTFNELSVALVYNQRRDKRPLNDKSRQAGIPDDLKLPEGFMHPKPCKGGEKGIALLPSEHMDEAEELMLKGFSMKKAYQNIKKKNLETNSPDPSHSFDNSTKECAIRESFEEVGLTFSIEDVKLVCQLEQNRVIPTIVNVCLMQTKNRGMTPPILTVDGTEIKEGMWGKLRAFSFEKDTSKLEKCRVTLDYYDEKGQSHPVEIPFKYALVIGQAIKKFRDSDIQKHSQIEGDSLFSSRENVEARVKQILATGKLNKKGSKLQDILGEPPESILQKLGICNVPGNTTQEKNDHVKALAGLGKQADEYHRKILALATAFKGSTRQFNAEDLLTIAEEGPAILSNLMSSQARSGTYARRASLFPLAPATPEIKTGSDIFVIPDIHDLYWQGSLK